MLSFSETFQAPLKPREDALSEKDKERAQEILLASNAIEYMSSEESDSGDTENESSRGPKPRKIRKLGWERTKLRNLKARIDGVTMKV